MRQSTGWKPILAIGLAALLALALVCSTAAEARYGGGRFGGRSGFGSFRSLPRIPSGPGRYAPSPGRGYVYPGRGLGFPGIFFFPSFLPFGHGSGFGGFAVLLMAGMGAFILFVMINDIRTRLGGGRGWRGYGSRQRGTGTYTNAMLQLALLPTGRAVIEALRELAKRVRTDTREGLAEALAETSVLLGRRPEVWSAARWLVDRAEDPDAAEARHQEWSAQERMKVSQEVFENVDGKVRESAPPDAPEAEVGAGFIATLIVAIDRPMFDTIPHPRQEDVARLLQKLAGVPPSALLGLEVLWAPDPPTQPLPEEDLLMRYPELQPL
jgi:uncharacterized membrane protein